MMRRSGVSPATLASNTSRGTPRCSASGQSSARQPWKLAAAARIACAVISGWPDAPDSPLHSGAADGAGPVGAAPAGGTVPVVALAPNSERRSNPWPSAGEAKAPAANAAAPSRQIDWVALAMRFRLGRFRVLLWGTDMLARPLMAVTARTSRCAGGEINESHSSRLAWSLATCPTPVHYTLK